MASSNITTIALSPSHPPSTGRQANAESFPDEIVIQIFSYLDIDGLKAASQVSKQWNAISKEDAIWEHKPLYETIYSLFADRMNLGTYMKEEGWKYYCKSTATTAATSAALYLGPMLLMPTVMPMSVAAGYVKFNGVFKVANHIWGQVLMSPMRTTSTVIKATGIFGSTGYVIRRGFRAYENYATAGDKITPSPITFTEELFTPDFSRWKWEFIRTRLGMPKEFESDPILSQNRCALSGKTILFPVEDEHGHLFEYKHIVAHIVTHGTCPVTGEPLELDELKVRKALFDQIRDRIHTLKGAI